MTNNEKADGQVVEKGAEGNRDYADAKSRKRISRIKRRAFLYLFLLLCMLLGGWLAGYGSNGDEEGKGSATYSGNGSVLRKTTLQQEEFFVVVITGKRLLLNGKETPAQMVAKLAKLSGKKVKAIFEKDARTSAENELERALAVEGLHLSLKDFK